MKRETKDKIIMIIAMVGLIIMIIGFMSSFVLCEYMMRDMAEIFMIIGAGGFLLHCSVYVLDAMWN
jgi:hypothetical protein